MSVSESDLEKFKRRLIKVVARMTNEGLSQDELLKKLKLQTKANYKVLWTRMRSLVLKKLRLLFSVGDMCSKVPPVARMTITDWLMFDLVLVNETIDMISLAGPDQEESTEVSLPQPPHLWDLFHMVKRHGVEETRGPDFVKAWVNLAIEYNNPASGRQCSPMLLQLRWHLLKEKTRDSFYEFWSKFNKLSNRPNKDELNKITPNELYSSIAKIYPHIVTKEFMPWKKLIEIGRVVNPVQFQKKLKRGVSTEKETPLAKVSEDTTTAGDVEVIEPQIETITLDDDSDDQGDHAEVTAKKTSTSQDKDVAPSTSKEKDVVPSTTEHMDVEVISPTSNDIETIPSSSTKNKAVLTPSTSKNIEVVQPSTSKDIQVIRPSTSKPKDNPPSNQEKEGTTIDITNDFVVTTDFDDTTDYSNTINMNDCIGTVDAEAAIAQQEDDIRMDAETLQAFCGEQYIVNSFDDCDIDQELMDTKPVVVPEVDGLSSVKIIGTTHVEEFSLFKRNTPSSNKSLASGDQVSKSVNKTSEKDNEVSKLLEQEISPYTVINSVIKIEEPDIREELKRQGKGDLIKIIPDASSEVVFDIIDDGIAFDDDDGVADKNDSDDESETDESSFKIDRKLLLYPIVYTVKLDDMNSLRKQKDFKRVTTQTLIENIFKESKIKTKANEEKLKEIVTEEESCGDNHEEMLPETKTAIQDSEEEYDDPITVLPIKETFIKIEEPNSEIIGFKETTNVIEELTEPPIKRIKISHHLFNKPKLRTYNPIQLCKNPDFNTRLKKINTGILVYQLNRNKLLDCKPLTIDLDKGFERKLIDNTVYLNTEEEKRADNSSILCELLTEPKQKQSNAEDSLLKLILEKDASAYVRKPFLEDQELLAARKSKTINLPDIDQVRKLNQRLLTAEVTPISFGFKQNDNASKTTENPIVTAAEESPPISPEESNSSNSDREDLPIAEPEENQVVGPDKNFVESTEISDNSKIKEPTKSTEANENIAIEDEQIVTEIKQEKQEPEKPDRFKSVENELTRIELATKDTLPDIEITESENSSIKQMRKKISQPKSAKSSQPYTPAWSRPVRYNEPMPGLVTNDTLLKMLKYIHGEEEDCVIVSQAVQEIEIEKRKKKKANRELRRKSGTLLKTMRFYDKDERGTPCTSAEKETTLPDPSTKKGKNYKTTSKSTTYISNDPSPNVHPQISSFCCWIKEIEYRINLPNFNLDSVPHPCLYFDNGFCTCCCREGNNKDEKATEQTNQYQNPAISPAVNITIMPANSNDPKTSKRKCYLHERNNSKDFSIQTDLPINTVPTVKPATVEASQTVKQPTLFLDPASTGVDTSSHTEILGILTAEELDYLQKNKEHPPIKVVAGPSQQKKYIIRKIKEPIHKNKGRILTKIQTDAQDDCIVLSDDEDEKNKIPYMPHLVIDSLQSNAPLTITSGSSNIPVEKQTTCLQQPTKQNQKHTPFKKIITHNKNQEAPLNLGQNKVLLTTAEVPSYLNYVDIKRMNNYDRALNGIVSSVNSMVTAPLINLPKGVGIVLMPDNTLGISIEPGTTVPESELAHMPTLLSLVQKQLGQHTGITPTIVINNSTQNNDISLLSDDENSVDKTTKTVNVTQESKSNEEDKSLEMVENNVLLKKNVSVGDKAFNDDSDIMPDVTNDTAKNVSLHCSEQLTEDLNDTQNPNAETTIEKGNEPISSDLNTSEAVSDSDLQEKEIEETQTLENIQKDNIEGQNKEMTASPNETLTQKEDPTTQETSPTKSFLKVKNFAAVNYLDVDAPSDAESGQIKKTILSDLMEMSGISSEDTVPLMPSTLGSVMPETPENLLIPVMPSNSGNLLTPVMSVSPGNIIPLVAPATPDISRLELNPVFTIKALKYAHNNNGKFYVLNLETGSIVPLKVSINRTKKAVVPHIKQISNSKEKIEAKIDLVDSDAPMEEEYLVDSDDSNERPIQTRPTRKKEVISGLSISQSKAIYNQKSLLSKHTGMWVKNSFVNIKKPDLNDPVKVKAKLTPRILCKGPLKKIKIKRGGEILIGRMFKINTKTTDSLLKNKMPNTTSKSPADGVLINVVLSDDTTEDASDVIKEDSLGLNKVALEEDKAEETPADKDYSSSDDEPLSILKDRKEKTKRTYTKRPLKVDTEDASAKRARTNDETNDGTIESYKIAEQIETSGIPERVAFTEETQKEGEENSNEYNIGLRMEEEELETFENANNDNEMEGIPGPSGEGADSELDDNEMEDTPGPSGDGVDSELDDNEMEDTPGPSGDGVDSELDDEDFILGA